MCRRLKVDEIECRVGTCNEKGCSLLLYKTARVDRAILTETYGELWQNDFKVIDGKMYGGIAIYNKDLKEWLWRWDCGTESNKEKEKGEASDCFKRAGFKWGIGVELYTTPFIWCNVATVKNENGKYQPVSKSFNLKEIGYAENGDINKLVITDDKGNIVYKTGSYTNPVNKKQKIEEAKASISPDFDLLEELKNKKDLPNLVKYYNDNKGNSKNLVEFTKEFNKLRTQLMKGNKQ